MHDPSTKQHYSNQLQSPSPVLVSNNATRFLFANDKEPSNKHADVKVPVFCIRYTVHLELYRQVFVFSVACHSPAGVSNNTGAIVGGVIGGLIAAAIAVILIIILVHRCRMKINFRQMNETYDTLINRALSESCFIAYVSRESQSSYTSTKEVHISNPLYETAGGEQTDIPTEAFEVDKGTDLSEYQSDVPIFDAKKDPAVTVL